MGLETPPAALGAALGRLSIDDIDRELERRGQLGRHRAAPELYASEVLGIRWWSKQVEIAHSVLENRRTVVYAGHGVGKTHGIAGLVQWHFDCFNPSITLTTAPNWSAIHDLLWGEIKAQRPGAAPGRLLDMKLEGAPMWYAAGHNAESSSGFQGRHEARVFLVFDEAMGIAPFIWEAGDAMMTSPLCRICALGNPTQTDGYYYEIREDPNWNAIHISCLEHPNIAAELAGLPPPYPKAVSLMWLREMIEKHCVPVSGAPSASNFEFPPGSGQWYEPNDIFRSRVLGLFPRQAANSVFSEEWVTKAREEPPTSRESDLQVGVDVARFGDDNTCIYARRGIKVVARISYNGKDTMETVGHSARLADSLGSDYKTDPKQIPIAVDDTGVGGGVSDRLAELGYGVVRQDFGGSAHRPDEYYNRGAEIWFMLAERARTKRLDLSGLDAGAYRMLSADLRARRYRIQSDKTLRVESKIELKKRLGRSPDDADACILAFAPVQLPLAAPVGVGERPSPWGN